MSIPTPHIETKDKFKIASTVLMPGDPLRAKMVAEEFLTNVTLVNTTRNMLGYTGEYKGKKASVVSSGMGMPSIGIYSYELFEFYEVENIIRIGSCGAYSPEINLRDIILCEDVFSESTYAQIFNNDFNNILTASKNLNQKIQATANINNIKIINARVHSADVFYAPTNYYKIIHNKYNCAVVEMEAFALFANAQKLNKNAACLLTVSDHLETKLSLTAHERQNTFLSMITLALESL